MAHLSGKRGDEIGRFGLGFKSVLAVSDAPQVLSRSVAFEFNSAAARSQLAEVGPALKRYPILRTATVVDARSELGSDPILAELGAWATTIVKLPERETWIAFAERSRSSPPSSSCSSARFARFGCGLSVTSRTPLVTYRGTLARGA